MLAQPARPRRQQNTNVKRKRAGAKSRKKKPLTASKLSTKRSLPQSSNDDTCKRRSVQSPSGKRSYQLTLDAFATPSSAPGVKVSSQQSLEADEDIEEEMEVETENVPGADVPGSSAPSQPIRRSSRAASQLATTRLREHIAVHMDEDSHGLSSDEDFM